MNRLVPNTVLNINIGSNQSTVNIRTVSERHRMVSGA